MKASPLEYRLRFLIHGIIFALGFWAPWNYALAHFGATPLDHGKTLWEWAAISLFQAGVLHFESASVLLLSLAIFFGALGAWFRVWGEAFLGVRVVHAGSLRDDAGVIADGPYRHLRNPLYVGTFLHTLALALLMPPSGAVFAIVVIALIQLRLIGAEEPFLAARLGEPYRDYCARVPRLLYSARPRVPASGLRPRWLAALAGELYFVAVPLCYAIFGWRYNSFLLTRCVVISLGAWLVVRAMLPRPAEAPASPQA